MEAREKIKEACLACLALKSKWQYLIKNKEIMAMLKKISFAYNLSMLSVCRPRWLSKGYWLSVLQISNIKAEIHEK